jgi:glycerophosphoryl diester phosphodiesterase
MTAVFAHRGYTHGFTENTLEAFLEAKRLGADGVELDVRRSLDGALVIHHDAVIDGLGPICEIAVRDLPAHIPLLADALAACEGMVVNVEIKNSPKDPDYDPTLSISMATAQAIDDAGWVDQVIVSSFDRATIDAARGADSRLKVGWLWEFMADVPGHLNAALEAGYQAVHPFVTEISAHLVDQAHGGGLDVNAWTVNAEHDMVEFTALGVDAIITDRLVEARAIVDGA